MAQAEMEQMVRGGQADSGSMGQSDSPFEFSRS